MKTTNDEPTTSSRPARPRGFAAMDRAKVSAIASKGGKAAHAAGRKGGAAPHARRGPARARSSEPNSSG